MPDIMNPNARGVAVTFIFEVTQAPLSMTDEQVKAMCINGVAVSSGLATALRNIGTSAVRPLTELLTPTH